MLSKGPLVMRLLLVSATVGLAISSLLLAGCSRAYDPKARHPEMPNYAAALLVKSLKARDCLEDSKESESIAKAQRESRRFYEDIAATMPAEPRFQRMLSEAANYFKGDEFDVWINCRSADAKVYQAGTNATDILEGLVQTLRSVERQGLDKRLLRRFIVMYGVLRTGEGMTHTEAIADLKRRLKEFGDF
jgi:hypothetical protein